MATEIKVPALGESVTTATVARWIKQPGETVAADEPLVELETDKVTVEVNAPAAGVLTSIAVPEGTEVEVGALLGMLDGAAGAAARPRAAQPRHRPAEAGGPGGSRVPPPIRAGRRSIRRRRRAGSGRRVPRRRRPPTPPMRRCPPPPKLMEENKVSRRRHRRRHRQGRPHHQGRRAGIPQPPAPAPPPPPAARPPRADEPREQRVRMTRLRRTIAARLKEAQNTAAMLTTFNEVDMSAVMALRAEYRDAFEKKHNGVRLGFMIVFVRACCVALKEFPAVNAEIDGDDIVYKNFVNMGIAVGGPSGLVVPVIRDADQLGFAEIEARDRRFRQARPRRRAEAGGADRRHVQHHQRRHLRLADVHADPEPAAVRHPGHAQDPGSADGRSAGKIEIRPMMYLAVSYDHRIVDGKEAVSFLVRVKEGVEDPRRLLLDL